MTDVFSVETRSRIMASIKGSGTRPESLTSALLESMCLDFVYQPRPGKVYGNADFVIPSARLLIFVDSGFWNGWNWPRKIRNGKTPKSNVGYWIPKILGNRMRRRRTMRRMRRRGWRVISIWDFQLQRDLDSCESRIRAKL